MFKIEPGKQSAVTVPGRPALTMPCKVREAQVGTGETGTRRPRSSGSILPVPRPHAAHWKLRGLAGTSPGQAASCTAGVALRAGMQCEL